MGLDRRSFVRLVAGAAGWLAAGGSREGNAAPEWQSRIHQKTRNTLFGPVGGEAWASVGRRPRSKSYPGRPEQALPDPLGADGNGGAPGPDTSGPSTGPRPLAEVLDGFGEAAGALGGGALDLPLLSRLLHHTNGITGPPIFRAAPSAGALYAGEIYLVVAGVEGLEPGLYAYLPPRHSLVSLGATDGIDTVRSALERPGRLGEAPLVVLLTNVFARYGWRYANRAYRYALIDSGHIGENLRLAARSLGLADASPLRFHDGRLNDLVGIDGRDEAVCAVHAVGRPSDRRVEAPRVRALRESGQAPEGLRPTARYHARTALVEAEAGGSATADAAPGPGTAGRGRTRGGGAAALPGGAGATVEACVRERRSAKRFADRPLSRAALDWILGAAFGRPALSRTGWMGGGPDDVLELRVAVHRVEGLPRGLYRYAPDAGELAPLRQTDLRAPLRGACLRQEKASTCAVACFMIADLRRAAERAGDRSYRDLLIECGAIGQRIYLAAEAAGVAARNLAAFRDDTLNALVGLDGRERAVLHLTLAGHGS